MRVSRALQAVLMGAALFAAGCSGGNGGGGNGGDPPVADAGDDAAARIHRSYTLNGAQSADPEGKDLDYTWSILSLPEGSAVTLSSGGLISNPSFTPDVEGLYVFGLTVSDGKKTSLLDTVEIDVHLRIAVFADRGGDLAADLELGGMGEAADFTSSPHSVVVGAARDVLITLDSRTRETQLLAYHAFNGSQEVLAAGQIDQVFAQGDYVAWQETRNGQSDLFARNLATGVEQRVTNDSLVETPGNLSNGVLTFTKDNPPYSTDVLMAGLDSLGVVGVSPMDVGVDEINPFTDGDTIVYTQVNLTQDVFAYDTTTQMTTAIATNTTDAEFALGVSGDFVILGIDTGFGASVYRQRISNSNRIPIGGIGASILKVDGDYVLLKDGLALYAHRLSTGATTVVEAAWAGSSADVAGGVASWVNESGPDYSVSTKVLPAGTTAVVATSTRPKFTAAVLDSGVGWDEYDDGDIRQAFYSADGGATKLLASYGKIYLADVTDAYDVAVIGGSMVQTFSDDTVDALSAAGVPMLALERDGSSVGTYFHDELLYNVSLNAADCGPAAVTFAAFPHPAVGDLPPGGFSVLERFVPGLGYEARAIDFGLSPPVDLEVLASFAFNPNTCVLGDETAIAAFTTSAGTMVIIDGVASDDIGLWEPVRRQLLQSEIRWLVDTRAP